ncbi:MAG: hypothetical protein OEO21_00615 [Candidatus Krumholzibacteria bacterium]|nr:hypothetical protein [Candidatus Krumholzibacteria bacterium]
MPSRTKSVRAGRAAAAAALALGMTLAACGEKKMPYDTNLLVNGSFEEVGSDGIPKGWRVAIFRGLPDQPEVQYAVDQETAADGRNSWRFKADPSTRRFYMLTQEVEVENAAGVRLRGWIQLEQVALHEDQFQVCNYFLTFYDEKHLRFQAHRPADKRTRPRNGTALWLEEDEVFRLPAGTRYVAVSCVLGADGSAWFDNVSLEVPTPIEWLQRKTPNYVFNWLREREFPEGAMENQQRIFDRVCERLEITSDVVVNYYLYPDSATLRRMVGVVHDPWASWKDREIHSTYPNDDHEVVHFILNEYGTPSRPIVEGVAYWLQDTWMGYPIHSLAAYWLAQERLPTLQELTNQSAVVRIESVRAVPAAASFVGFLIGRWGVPHLLALFREANGVTDYGRLAAAFESVYGVSLDGAEASWRVFLSQAQSPEVMSAPAEEPGSGRAIGHGDREKR